MVDHYAALGVSAVATVAEIKRAYRSKAKTAHPDGGGSQEAFTQLSAAYAVLSDSVARSQYDLTRHSVSGALSGWSTRTYQQAADVSHAVAQAQYRAYYDAMTQAQAQAGQAAAYAQATAAAGQQAYGSSLLQGLFGGMKLF